MLQGIDTREKKLHTGMHAGIYLQLRYIASEITTTENFIYRYVGLVADRVVQKLDVVVCYCSQFCNIWV